MTEDELKKIEDKYRGENIDPDAFYERLLYESQNDVFSLIDELRHVIAQRNILQDDSITWAECPCCHGLIAMTGVPCIAGVCTNCGHAALESDYAPADPIAIVRSLLNIISKSNVDPWEEK